MANAPHPFLRNVAAVCFSVFSYEVRQHREKMVGYPIYSVFRKCVCLPHNSIEAPIFPSRGEGNRRMATPHPNHTHTPRGKHSCGCSPFSRANGDNADRYGGVPPSTLHRTVNISTPPLYVESFSFFHAKRKQNKRILPLRCIRKRVCLPQKRSRNSHLLLALGGHYGE